MASTTPTDDVDFIETILVPEMVHDRCFCDSNSREFVELNKVVSVKPSSTYSLNDHLRFNLYEVSLVVDFSGDPRTFNVLVKLIPESFDVDARYGALLNEEILANKAKLQYGEDFFPKYYTVNMGKYGRPVVVVDDPQANGYTRVLDRQFNDKEAEVLIDLIGRFHGKGFRLKEEKPAALREFYAKFTETTFDKELESKTVEKFSSLLNKLKSSIASDTPRHEALLNLLGTNDAAAYYERCVKNLTTAVADSDDPSLTICQGFLARENVWFKRTEDGKLHVRVLDWQRVRYASNAIDLVTILLQCEAVQWPKLIVEYVTTVQKERPEMSGEELCAGMSFPGLPYALVVLGLMRDEVDGFDKCLKYFIVEYV